MSYWHFPSLQEGGRFMFRHTVLHYGYVKSTPIFLQQINVFTDIPTYSLLQRPSAEYSQRHSNHFINFLITTHVQLS
jgi:hypothetical protein